MLLYCTVLTYWTLLGVIQDFALDPEEARMRAAAHHMVRNMTAGMALITCREPLHISINNNLKNAFLTALMVSIYNPYIPQLINWLN